jgi:integrase
LDADFRDLRGNYSPAQVQPRDLPGDDLIATWRDLIPNPEWRLAYSLIAAYGLRPHEVFNCHFEQFPVLTVGGKTKTGQRRVYPFYPEWADWGCGDVNLPAVTGRNNTDLGQRVTHAFTRYEIPFAPYDLRHAWAIRTMMFGLADSLAAKQMGHSVKVHCEIYHRWISDLAQDRAYQALLEKGDRPHPPDRPSPNQPNQPDNPN